MGQGKRMKDGKNNWVRKGGLFYRPEPEPEAEPEPFKATTFPLKYLVVCKNTSISY